MRWIADTQEEASDLKLRPYLNGDLCICCLRPVVHWLDGAMAESRLIVESSGLWRVSLRLEGISAGP